MPFITGYSAYFMYTRLINIQYEHIDIVLHAATSIADYGADALSICTVIKSVENNKIYYEALQS